MRNDVKPNSIVPDATWFMQTNDDDDDEGLIAGVFV